MYFYFKYFLQDKTSGVQHSKTKTSGKPTIATFVRGGLLAFKTKHKRQSALTRWSMVSFIVLFTDIIMRMRYVSIRFLQ